MRRSGWIASGIVAASAASALAVSLFAPVRFPQPGGPYGVGTTTRHWADPSRPDLLGAGEPREIAAQVWYPTLATAGIRSDYLPDAPEVFGALLEALRDATSGRTSLPPFLFRKLAASSTNALVDAPPVPGRALPAIVVLSGFGGFRTANTILIEELASRGYGVIGIDQPYVSARTRRADGGVVRMIRRGHLYDEHPRERVVEHLAADVGLALDAVARDETLGAVVDSSRAGVAGVSLGGTVAASAAGSDPRIRACLVMDAAVLPSVAAAGVPCAAMWMTRPVADMRGERRRAGGWSEEVIAETVGSVRAAFSRQAPGAGWLVQIRGMSHIDFTDASHWFPWARWVGLSGPIGARGAREVVTGWATAFFDHALRGRSSPLLSGEADDPRVRVTAA